MRRMLSVYLPRWPVQRIKRRQRLAKQNGATRKSDRHDLRAVVLVTTHHNVQTVAGCCGVAAKSGVRTGITLAQARSMLNRTEVEVHCCAPHEDAIGLRRLARWALRLAPIAAPDEPDGLLLDISGCERLYDNESQHIAVIDDALGALGLTVRLAVAPTFGCAWAVARYGDRRLSTVAPDSVSASLESLPVEALRIDGQTCDALAAINVTRIGELMSIPRGALADRFGPGLLMRLDQALGQAFECTESIKPAEVLTATWEFDGPIDDRDIIENTIYGLLEELLAKVGSTGRGVSKLVVELCPHDASPSRMELSPVCPTVDLAHLWVLLRNRLEAFVTAHPIEIITLRAARVGTLTNRQRIFDTALGLDHDADASALGALFDQLAERLGAQSVVQFEPRQTYTPECAFAPVATMVPTPHRVTSTPAPDVYPASRPSRMLDQPVAIDVMALLPDSPPVWFRWQGREWRVSAGCGPERIASRWWLCGAEESDARDYYAVQTESGGVFWLFRLLSTGRWFLHGLWA